MNANTPVKPTIVDAYLALRRWWWLCLATFVIVVGGATTAAFVWPPTYRSTVLLGPSDIPGRDSSRSPAGALGALKSLTGTQTDKSGEAIAILESAAFTRRFIERHNLMPALFADKLDTATGKWKGRAPVLEDGVLRFSRDVRGISLDDKTGFVKLTIDSGSAALAEHWANDLVRDLNAEMRNRAINEARVDLNFLKQQISAANVPEVRMSLVGLVRERMETEMLAVNRPDYAFKILDPAFRSKYHYQPRKSLVIGIGVLVALLLSFGMVAIASTIRSLRLELERDGRADTESPASAA